MPQVQPLRWRAFEHDHVPRGSDWFIALGVAAVSIALTSVILGNVLFAILVLAAAVALGLLARMPREIVEFELSERGIRAGKRLYRFENIIAFWVEEERSAPLLLIDTTAILSPNLAIPLENVDPRAVRAFLLEHVNETLMKESVSLKILETLGL